MEIQFLGTGAGQPSTKRNVAGLALKLLEELNEVWLFDAGEATQHQILQTNIRPRKITKIFISHNHGDHIFGLPGLLSSRSFQGEATPLTIYGPAGLEQFVRSALRVSRAHLSYPLHFVVINHDGPVFANDKFTVYAAKLDHRVPSYGYRVVERSRPGELLVQKALQAGVPKGPLLGKLKAGEDIALANGTILHGADFIGPAQPGRIVTIIYDTRTTPAIDRLAQNADVLVHESTFASGEEKLARQYYHSTCTQAAACAKRVNAGRLFLTHVSARYTGKGARQLEKEAKKIFPHTKLVYDLDAFEIPLKGDHHE
ncbi:MAG: ribonuclease Z [Lactobacillus sp.]|jgi:ribonuclease Z|nr:ribonuclease Z [Lactobacillus sp.]